MAPAVQAENFEMGPGTTIHPCNGTDTVFCTACTGGNETCPECENCGVCSIDQDIQPGETYENGEGTCDVEVECAECDDSGVTQKNYLLTLYIDKHEGQELGLTLEVEDFIGTLIESKLYEWEPEDVAAIKYRYNFTCPTEVIFDSVNADTCYSFFEDYYSDKDPLSMMLAADMTEYRTLLLACQENKSQIEWQIAHFEELYHNCDNTRQNAVNKVNEINQSMLTMEGRVTAKNRGVVATWQWVAALGWLCFVLLGFFGFVYNKTEGGTLR